jgi:hypothetical protein
MKSEGNLSSFSNLRRERSKLHFWSGVIPHFQEHHFEHKAGSPPPFIAAPSLIKPGATDACIMNNFQRR